MKTLVIALALILSAGFAFAEKDLKTAGSITVVDSAKQQITVTAADNTALIFAVVPSTEIDFEKQRGKPTFADLTVGTWVEVEYLAGQGVHTAQEIDIYPAKK